MKQRPFSFIKSPTGKRLLVAATSVAILTSTITPSFAATPAQELTSAFPSGVNPSTATLAQVTAALQSAINQNPADGADLLAAAISLRPAKTLSADTTALVTAASTTLNSIAQPIAGATTAQQLNNALVMLKVNPPAAKSADIQKALTAAVTKYPTNGWSLLNQALSILPSATATSDTPKTIVAALPTIITQTPASADAIVAQAVTLLPDSIKAAQTSTIVASASATLTTLTKATPSTPGATPAQLLDIELLKLKVNPVGAPSASILKALPAAITATPGSVLALVNQAVSTLPASDIAAQTPVIVTTTLATKSLLPLTTDVVKNVAAQAASSMKTAAPSLSGDALDLALANIANNAITVTKIKGTTIPNAALTLILGGVATSNSGFSSDQDAITFARGITVLNVANASSVAKVIAPLISSNTNAGTLASSLAAVDTGGKITDKVRFDIAYGLTLADSADAASIASGVASKLAASVANYSTLANSVIGALGSNATSPQIAGVVNAFVGGTTPYVAADAKDASKTTFASNIASANPAAGLVVASTVASTLGATSDYGAFASAVATAAFKSKTPLTGSALNNELAAIAVEVSQAAYANHVAPSAIASLVAGVIKVSPSSTYQIVGQVLSEVNFSASDRSAVQSSINALYKPGSTKDAITQAVLAVASNSSDFSISNWPMQPPVASH